MNAADYAIAKLARKPQTQTFLREVLAALDAMPDKKLIAGDLETAEGVCVLGCIAKARHLDATHPLEALGIPGELAGGLVMANDSGPDDEDGALRWQRMHNWIDSYIHHEGPQ